MTTFSLSADAESLGWDDVRRRVGDSLASGERALAVDLDGLTTFDTAAIASLISILRDVRETGGSLSLRATEPATLATLRVTGLDRVFDVGSVVAPEARETPVAARRRARSRIVVSSIAVLFFIAALLGARASAAPEMSPRDIVANVVARDADLSSYRARVAVDIRLRSFPYASQHLDGTTYFKRPHNFEVVFERVPSYAKGFESVYSDIDDPSGWDRRFELAAAGEKTIGGRRDLVVRLVQKVRGMIDHEDVAIDPATWRIDQMEWHYYNGGVISMTQQYRALGNFDVLASQHATIHIPFVHAAADATYSDYRTNVAIDDSVFTRQP